ncbi:MAG: response regulator [Fibromonadaceae bacterium]|nr:response regulator [Fibromonadaceae bacterium]
MKLHKQNEIRSQENLKEMRKVLFAGIALFVFYSGLRFIETTFFSGNQIIGYGALGGGATLSLIFLIVYFAYPHPTFFPLFMGSMAMVSFIALSIYMKAIDFHYFVMLLVVSLLSSLKNFRLLAIYVAINVSTSIFMFIFITPRLEWLDSYRFFIQFMLFLYGSFFILIQTRKVADKENRAEQALLSFSSLLQSTPNYVLVTDSSNRVRYISEPMLKLAHFVRREFAVGQPLIDLFHEKTLKIMFADILNRDSLFESLIKINVDGEERYFKVISDKLTGTDGGKFIDITDITPLVESRKAAEEANAAKSKFLATMSHEIRTPLNAILGISEIKLERKNITSEIKDSFQKIRNSGYTLLGIINDILDLSKIGTGKFEIIPIQYDPASLINDTVQLNIMRIGGRPIDFVLKVSENLPSALLGDELRIKQVLNNLLSNAIKYTDKGKVTLEANSQIENDEVRLIFTVRDTGQGMAQEQVAKLFDDYSQFNKEANRTKEGTGLGMSIVKNLVELMNGKITVESELGVGTTAIVELMQEGLGADALGKMDKIELVRDYMPFGKVLIVDDLEANIFVARGLLQFYGLKIEIANSGFEALDKIKGNEYDIVFMDHMMPEMDGVETVKRIRELDEHKNLPIVALTANAVSGTKEMFFANGFNDFLSKPIDVLKLDAILKKWIPQDKKIPEIEGINVRDSFATTGGTMEKYLKMLAISHKDGLQKIEEMKVALENNNYPLYATYVHALKSMFANIGVNKLSKTATLLEAAAKQKDSAFISAQNDIFLADLQRLLSSINKVLENNLQHNTDFESLKSELLKLKEALDIFDIAAINEIANNLQRWVHSAEVGASVEGILRHVLLGEYEEAKVKIYHLSNKKSPINLCSMPLMFSLKKESIETTNLG